MEKVTLNPTAFTNLLKATIKAYQFMNKNQKPPAIIIPLVEEVDGVPIEYEEEELDIGGSDETD